uniref:Uncharacterized protein n=1 Tax=Panagrellus redivivus TaxID=6233 RepID=A0A7E4UYU9_PANRE
MEGDWLFPLESRLDAVTRATPPRTVAAPLSGQGPRVTSPRTEVQSAAITPPRCRRRAADVEREWPQPHQQAGFSTFPTFLIKH